MFDRITVLAADTAESSNVPTYVAWAICVVALIGIVIAYRRWT